MVMMMILQWKLMAGSFISRQIPLDSQLNTGNVEGSKRSERLLTT
jgi:hypothetical protein